LINIEGANRAKGGKTSFEERLGCNWGHGPRWCQVV